MGHSAPPACSTRRPRLVPWLAGALAAASLTLLGAGPGASPAHTEENQVARGRQVYAESCAKCHGKFLEGNGGVPRLAGSGSRVRSNYTNAKNLYEFISTAMPMDAPGTLKKEDYWAIVAFAWAANGMDPGTTIGPDNAAQLTWEARPTAASKAQGTAAPGPSGGSQGGAGAGGVSPVAMAAAAAVLILAALGVGFGVARRSRAKGNPKEKASA